MSFTYGTKIFLLSFQFTDNISLMETLTEGVEMISIEGQILVLLPITMNK